MQIFKYLKSLEVSDSKDVKSGYSITFVSFSTVLFLFCYMAVAGNMKCLDMRRKVEERGGENR